MGRCLLDRMGSENEKYFKADKDLLEHPSLATFEAAKQANLEYQKAEHREYQALVEEGTWTQTACDQALRMADQCTEAYIAWLNEVEKRILNPSPEPKLVIPCIAPPTIISAPEKKKDKAFF